ncbi:MAG: transglutaminase family protein [Candidatus Thorarchaeota archaeon]
MSPILITIQPSNPLNSSPSLGVSNYTITQSVKYRVEINFTLTHNSGVGDYIFKFARLNERTPNSTLTKYTPPYQESKLVYNSITGDNIVAIMLDHNDKFNNTYDLFNVSLASGEEVSLDQKYIIKLNAIRFQDIEDSDIGTYDMSDDMFDLYCNHTEPYYQRDDVDLISLSNSLVNPSDNPVEKAQKILNWVSDNIDYNGNLPDQEKGASWAYDNLEGDCSEYSSLMVTLLRIQDIPARKVTGFLVSNNPNLRPRIGDRWNFYASDSGYNILGHAWVEYYVPDIGWIACDPTWQSATNYFNRIDFLRFNLNVGANFFFPPSHVVSEFGNPIFSYFFGDSFDYDYNVKVTVIQSDLAALPTIPIMLIIFVVIGIAAITITVVTVVLLIRRSRKK